MYVREWMSSPAVSVPPNVRADAALRLMEKHGIRRFPVVHKGQLAGIVTKSDLMTAFGREKGASRTDTRTVADLMTHNPASVVKNETLEAAAQIMLQRKVSGLPVIEEGKVVGIITESDIFRALCGMLGIGEQGTRLTLSVGDGADLLQVVRKRVGGMAIRSLVTMHDSKRKVWDVVLKVRGRIKR